MYPSDPRSRDNLDILIERTLKDRVADAEAPPQVWGRIRSELTRSSRRPALRWSGPVLQAALLAVAFFVLGGVSLWQEWSSDQLARTPTAAPTVTQAAPGDAELELDFGSGVVSDTSETQLLREYSSSQTRAAVAAELERRAPGILVPADDIPPHPRLQASAAAGVLVGDSGGVAEPVLAPGLIW